jgi:hypothetical protein
MATKQQICELQQQELALSERKRAAAAKPWNGGCHTRVMRGGRANVDGKSVLLCNNPFHVCKNGRFYCRIHCEGGLYEDITCESDFSDDDDEDEDEDEDEDFIASEDEANEVDEEEDNSDSEYVPSDDEDL